MAVENYKIDPHQRRRHAITYVVLTTLAILLISPIAWLLISSFKAESELLAYPIQIFPNRLLTENYYEATTRWDYGKYAFNSAFLATMSAILTVTTSSLVGFGFARIEAPGRGRLFGIVVALLMVPNIVYVIPQFVVYARLNLVGTWWPWVLGGLAASPFHIFLFRQFFMNFPKELEEAAEVDGCSLFRIYWQIFLPNAKAALAVSFILVWVWVWGDWFTPLIYLNNENTTLAVQLTRGYVDPSGNPLITLSMAGSVLYILPPIIMFFLGQKQILEGVVTSGLKG